MMNCYTLAKQWLVAKVNEITLIECICMSMGVIVALIATLCFDLGVYILCPFISTAILVNIMNKQIVKDNYLLHLVILFTLMVLLYIIAQYSLFVK